jgi:hypothetical protein
MTEPRETPALNFPVYVAIRDDDTPSLAFNPESNAWSLHLHSIMGQEEQEFFAAYYSAGDLAPLVEQARLMGAAEVLNGIRPTDDATDDGEPLMQAEWSGCIDSFLVVLNERRMHEEQAASN